MWTWTNYYGAENYMVRAADERFFELGCDFLAQALKTEPRELFNCGFGTNWQAVQSRDLDSSIRWFAQGDPWNALLGVGVHSVVVAGLDMSTAGLAGPGTLTSHDPHYEHRKDDLVGMQKSVQRVRRSMNSRWKRCTDCQSPRLGGWCSCDGPVRGIIYD